MSKNYKFISLDNFHLVLLGQLRNNADFSHHYVTPEIPGNHFKFENYVIGKDDSENIHINSGLNNVHLYFINRKIKLLTVSFALDVLSFENCELSEITFNNTTIRQLVIENPLIPINVLTVKATTLLNAEIDTVVKKLNFNSESSRGEISNATLKRRVDNLSLTNINAIKLKSDEAIGTCELNNSLYPFKQRIAIERLVIREHRQKHLLLEGLFGTIELSEIYYDIYLEKVTCLKHFHLTHHNRLINGPEPKMILSNVYVGGELRISNSDAVLTAEVNNQNNLYVFINELNLYSKLGGINMRVTGEQPIHINKFSIHDITFTKDTNWTLQWIFFRYICFDNFKNAGTGNIIGGQNDYFEPLDVKFADFLVIFEDQELYERYFSSSGNTTFSDGNKPNQVIFKFSDLGKVNFIDTDLSNFTLYFYSTKLSEIFLAGSKMPSTVEAFDIGRSSADLNHQIRIANSQLKKIHEQQGDQVASNEYFAGEMNAYYSGLNWSNHFWEKLPLFFNKYSSNHGQSWSKALVTTIVVTLVFYTLFVWSLGNSLDLNLNAESINRFIRICSYYFEFINPIHKLETFSDIAPKNNISPSSRFIDAIARIFAGYCIFQLIQAFRKHGKTK